ncbi:MAG TPA: cytochrome P450 [Acidimicrobiia bacterium]|nr:cytochrome P450 [Acidimicrobiia bacterium]
MTKKDDVTVDFDHHSSAISVDPYATWTDLRSRCPVAWTKAHDGYWILTAFAEVYQATRDDDTFRCAPSVGIPSYGVDGQIPLDTDPPMTQKYRRILQQQFSPAAAAEAEPVVRQIANELVDGFIERGECDFITDLTTPVPARFILRILGFGEERWVEFCEWVHNIVHNVTNDPESALEGAVALYGAIIELIEERRTSGLRDDIVSQLLRSELDGQPLEDDVITSYMTLLIFGGLDTTSSAVGNALVWLDRQPELRRQLLDRPELIPAAVEEFLRIDAPVQGLGRTLSRDIEMAGCPMKAGDRVLLSWASANRDPAEFENPDTVDFERLNNRHLTFGVGLHRCLGSNYGRTMFRIMLETILARMPDFELVDDPDQHRFADIGVVYGHTHLPARFTPGRKLGV